MTLAKKRKVALRYLKLNTYLDIIWFYRCLERCLISIFSSTSQHKIMTVIKMYVYRFGLFGITIFIFLLYLIKH